MSNRMLMRVCVVGALVTVVLEASGDEKKPVDRKENILRRFRDEFILLTPGKGPYLTSFQMGSAASEAEKPVHQVSLQHEFSMARYEVTQELYEAVSGGNPSRWKGPRNSVELVSWTEAREFCQKATVELRVLGLLTERELVRLPSEAEWEYTCRAGTNEAYSFGDDAKTLGDFGWFTGNAKGNDPPVGKRKPNAWGFFDMHGYVWEWCQDAWHDNYRGAPPDGSAWDDPDARQRVARGGSWADSADHCRSAFRQRFAPDHRSDAVGFRCVRANASR